MLFLKESWPMEWRFFSFWSRKVEEITLVLDNSDVGTAWKKNPSWPDFALRSWVR